MDYAVEKVMSRDLKFVFEHEEVEVAASTMAKLKIRRLAVLNNDKRLVGVISLADIAANHDDVAKGALHQVSAPEVRAPAPTGSYDSNITVRPQLKESSDSKAAKSIDEAGKESFPASDPPAYSSSSFRRHYGNR
jgi:CBS-domain-containing membrane protein